ncbi:hypothetical protein [Spirulina sp. 06S082]|uniref:hypothetical protein n=1 Tax=Spirulina sp. 06S082 TaxID=3110248 RepID=UPI002B21F3FC|nr:hypothetical protein [Spirulina sp. 06S082]MEA5470431.1 hypothetical protein [Spirulina sp. 06S082]
MLQRIYSKIVQIKRKILLLIVPNPRKQEAIVYTFGFVTFAFILGLAVPSYSDIYPLNYLISVGFISVLIGLLIEIISDSIDCSVKKEKEFYQNSEDVQYMEYLNLIQREMDKHNADRVPPTEQLEKYRKHSITREVVSKLANLADEQRQDNPLYHISVSASIHALDMKNSAKKARKQSNQDSFDSILKEDTLVLLHNDIFTYLRAWLVCSILFGRIMNIEKLPQRCNKKTPCYLTYVKAIKYIKRGIILDELLNEPLLEECLGQNKEKKDFAKEVITIYLQQLIELLNNQKDIEENQQKTNFLHL